LCSLSPLPLKHELAERCLRHGLNAENLIRTAFNGYLVDQEMADAVQIYLDTVRREIGPGDVLMIEHRVDLSQLNPPAPMFGTADAIVYQPKSQRLVITDLKPISVTMLGLFAVKGCTNWRCRS
jgi:hypothetical protein